MLGSFERCPNHCAAPAWHLFVSLFPICATSFAMINYVRYGVLGWDGVSAFFPRKPKKLPDRCTKPACVRICKLFIGINLKLFVYTSVFELVPRILLQQFDLFVLCVLSRFGREHLVLLSRKQTQLSCCCSAPATCMIAVLCVVPGKQCNEIYRVLQINQQLQSTGHPEF